MAETIGIIGLGAIGGVLAAALAADAAGPTLGGVLVRSGGAAAAKATLPGHVRVVTTLDDLLARSPSLVVECAGQGAVRDYGQAVLARGIDLMIVSTGALADERLLAALRETAARAQARMVIPAGAIAGLDGLGALKAAGLNSVLYTSVKPPAAWKDTPAATEFDLFAIATRTLLFEGSAREAALRYPKNANLAATVALAGVGLDRTVVRLVADPAAAGNTGTIEATSTIGRMTAVMDGLASANPKTSASTAFSLLHAIRHRSASFAI